jgi:short-subunit dehydrogenase
MSERTTALVTGASSGIGAAFARALAARGQDVVLVARSTAKLEALATELEAQHAIRATVLPCDLSGADAVDTLLAALAERSLVIDTLINNAGFGTHGPLVELDPAREREEIALNVGALAALTRALLPGMVERRRGGIVNVASTAAFQPVPYMATYGATKAFVLSFTEAVAEEVRGSGVHVVALCPGQTETAFFDTIEEARVGLPRTSEQVVATGLRALDHGHVVAVDGLPNVAMTVGLRFVPRAFVRRMAAAIERPKKLRGR